MAIATYDGVNKIIIIETAVTEFNVIDLYSEWKDWTLESDNTKYLQAFSSIGGEPLGGGQFLGSTFFLENDWKIRPFEGNHTLIVKGNLYTRDSSSPFVSTLGAFNVTINLVTSSLVTTVETGGGSSLTASQVANAVWNQLTSSNNINNSFGNAINQIKLGTETIENKVNVIDTNLLLLDTALDIVHINVLSVLSNLSLATELINTVLKYSTNRSKVDKNNKTLTIYDDDGVTPIKIFNLKDFLGSPSVTEVAERAPV